jgi:hypothetical protein
MRVFAVEGAPLRIVAEGVSAGPAMTWDEENCLTEEQLLKTPEGLAALEAWQRGDDSVYEISESADRALADAEDALLQAGLAARPDLQTRLGGAFSADEIENTLNEVRKAGAETLDQS